MTLGEAAGDNQLFMANAIAETTAMAGFAPVSCERAAARNQIGVSDTQNVIGLPVDATGGLLKRVRLGLVGACPGRYA